MQLLFRETDPTAEGNDENPQHQGDAACNLSRARVRVAWFHAAMPRRVQNSK